MDGIGASFPPDGKGDWARGRALYVPWHKEGCARSCFLLGSGFPQGLCRDKSLTTSTHMLYVEGACVRC